MSTSDNLPLLGKPHRGHDVTETASEHGDWTCCQCLLPASLVLSPRSAPAFRRCPAQDQSKATALRLRPRAQEHRMPGPSAELGQCEWGADTWGQTMARTPQPTGALVPHRAGDTAPWPGGHRWAQEPPTAIIQCSTASTASRKPETCRRVLRETRHPHTS